MREMTTAELLHGLCAEADQAKSEHKAQWDLLIELAEIQDQDCGPSTLTRNRRWILKRVAVRGFRGLKEETELLFAGRVGLNVFFGPNGSGKSSIAEAVRFALEGRVGATHIGVSNRQPGLWVATDQRATGADTSEVTIDLTDSASGDSLRIRARIDGLGNVTRDGVLSNRDATVELSSEAEEWRAWNDALRASPPILSYAQLADELRRKADLQAWLTACLAMDAAAIDLNSRVQEKVAESKGAVRELEGLKARAVSAIEEVDRIAAENGIRGLSDPCWDELTFDVDINDWLGRNGFSKNVESTRTLRSDVSSVLMGFAKEMNEVYLAFSAAQRGVLGASIDGVLVQLAEQVEHAKGDLDGVPCPVCGTVGVDWVGRLLGELSSLKNLQAVMLQMRDLQSRYRKEVEAIIGDLKVLGSLCEGYGNHLGRLELISDRIQASSVEIGDLSPSLFDAYSELATWITDPETVAFMEAVQVVSGQRMRLRRDRWAAVEEFVEVFERRAEMAAKLKDLTGALSRWNKFLRGRREERAGSFQELLKPAVGTLLEDAGLAVEQLKVDKNSSEIRLLDRMGEQVELAHLSAGQRNALILGPVVASMDSSVFGFSFLDDPVHAFDELRVDKLATLLCRESNRCLLLVATHDARLVEYLRVRAPEKITVHSILRGLDGVVRLAQTHAPAREALKLVGDLRGPMSETEVRENESQFAALFRMSLDAGLESFFLLMEARGVVDWSADARGEFDKALKTRSRAGVVARYLMPTPESKMAFDDAWGLVQDRLNRWNSASHSGTTVSKAVGSKGTSADATNRFRDDRAAVKRFLDALDSLGATIGRGV